ncbi:MULTISPECIES: hypothetical protein, partial [Mesorhizobium]|uniref:hypothetical protein n=1 Tax=Mesorhizobium TaxID=68287 RepID=UPI00197E416C
MANAVAGVVSRILTRPAFNYEPICFSKPGQRLLDLLCRGIRALDVVDHLMPQYRKLRGAMH